MPSPVAQESLLLKYAFVFTVISLVARAFGFSGIAARKALR